MKTKNVNETGHVKNVANFEELISFTTGYGTAYNPTKTSIKSANLNLVLTNSRAAITSVNAALPSYKNAISAREAAFEPVGRFVTRVYNALLATDTSLQVHDNAKTLVRKIEGRRASKKLSVEEVAALTAQGQGITQVSASQMSYDNRLDNIDKLIKMLISVSLYAPNENDLKTAALTIWYNDLKTKNSAVLNAIAPLSNARLSRNDILYKESTGLVSVALDVKLYVKSLFGARSPQYKQVSGLKFTKVK
jgi:hypothetical protein